MEWVETTAKTVDEAKDLALDQLGVTADEAEFEVVDEPRPGLFGRLRGEARVRARVMPTAVRPKQQRRPRGEGRGRDGDGRARNRGGDRRAAGSNGRNGQRPDAAVSDRPARDTDEAREAPEVSEVSAAAEEFMTGLAEAFGYQVTAQTTVEGTEIDIALDGESLGLLIGPGGRTLLAVQDLARVAAQRRLGDHDTRLRVDVAGYRERRRVALERFASTVAEEVRTSGNPRALDPMPSADRKVIHDALTAIDGVSSHSEGEDPQRRIVVSPA
ncbi:MAG: RNA-binding cell elongation regulator Jag/EloR [Desertimonas sp.]